MTRQERIEHTRTTNREQYRLNPIPCAICGQPLLFGQARKGNRTCGYLCGAKHTALTLRERALRRNKVISVQFGGRTRREAVVDHEEVKNSELRQMRADLEALKILARAKGLEPEWRESERRWVFAAKEK